MDSNHKSPWTPGGTIQKYSPDISYHHSSIPVSQDPVHQTTIGSHDHHTPISTGSHDHHSLTTTGSNDRHNLTATGSHDHHSSTASESHDHHSSTNTSSHYLTEGVEETLSDLYKEDSIGNTVFSKVWVLSVLVRVIKAVSIEQDQTQLEKNGGTNMNRPQPNFNSINKSDTCSEEDTSFVNEDTVGGTTASVDIDSNVLSKNMSDDESATIPRAEVMGNDSMKKSGDGSVLELEEQLEGQLCALWDASMNEVSINVHVYGHYKATGDSIQCALAA